VFGRGPSHPDCRTCYPHFGIIESLNEIDRILAEHDPKPEVSASFPFPIMVNPDMPLNEIRLTDREGNVLARITNIGNK